MQKIVTRLGLALLALGALAALAQPGGGIMHLDSDGDGLVSRDEFQFADTRRGPRMLDKADQDGDGSVTREEVLSAIDQAAEERKARMSGHMFAMFDSADADGDGVLTQEEAHAHAFSRVDANGDGYVTDEEARQMHEQRRGMHERRGPRD